LDDLLNPDGESGNDQRGGAIVGGAWGDRIALLSGGADSAKHPVDASADS
jgi:hypothetical protein